MPNPDIPPSRRRALIPVLIGGLAAVTVVSLAFGPVALGPDRIGAAILGHGDRVAATILFDLRLPRTIVGLIVGGMLGLAGAVLQGYLRNPLAEPSVLGASNAAALGAVGAIYFGLYVVHPVMLPLLAILAALLALILLIALLMDDTRPGGFVFIDEPFAHLDVANIDRVGRFLGATRAQYLITTPVTHNANVFAPAQLTLVTSKKAPGEGWAPPIGVLKRAK